MGSANDSGRLAITILDYLSQASGFDLPTAAECATNSYDRVNVPSLVLDNPKKAEKIVQEITAVQFRAGQFLQGTGDLKASARFLRSEIALRNRALVDLAEVGEPQKAIFRTQRLLQTTYLVQAYERADDGKGIDNLLAGSDIELFQSQTIAAWLKAVSSCPSWNISSSGGISDSRLAQDVCLPQCRSRAKIAVETIDQWRQIRRADWNRNAQSKELNMRLNSALKQCRKS